MNSNRLLAGASLLLAGFILALTNPGRALATNAAHALDVFVTGGSVGIDPSQNTVQVGNASLNVQGTVSLASGTSVGLNIPAGQTLPVSGSLALNDGAGAVTLSAQAVDNGSSGGGVANILDGVTFTPFTVPAGKRLVVDGIALFVSVPGTIHFNSVFIRDNHPTAGGTLQTTVQLTAFPVGDNPSFRFYGHVGPMRAYFEPGDTLQLGFTTVGASNSSTANLTLYGRLVPAI